MKQFLKSVVIAALIPSFLLGQQSHTVPTLDRNNTWTGVNSYTQSPQVPTPVNPNDAVPKNYVDSHSGGGANIPAGGIPALATGLGATPFVALPLSQPFYTVQQVPNYYLKTTFNEASAGSSVLGTVPAICQNGCTGAWSTDESAVSAVYSAGGLTFTGSGSLNAGGISIDVGHSDYTFRVSITSLGDDQRSSIAIRRTDSNNAIVIAFNGVASANIYDLVNGNLGASLAYGNFNLQNLIVTASGNTITVGDGSGTPPLSVNIADNLTGTTIALTQDGTEGATYAGLTIEGTPSTTNVNCVGFTNADGTCSAPGTSSMVGTNAQGKFASMPELGVSTDPFTGATSIAWKEDVSIGQFDCRDSKYSGGCLGPTPGLALQGLANDMICYEALTGKHPETVFPNASMRVGTPDQPTLIFPAGGYYHGSLSINGSGTTFQATYNNVRALQFNTGQSAVCSDGHLHTANLQQGSYVGFGENGCEQGVCTNIPGDNDAHPNGGPMQAGMFIGDSQAYVHLVAASSNGGDGLQIDGIDSYSSEIWGFNNMFWYLFGKNQPGQTYDPSTDGWHCNVILSGVDNRTSGVETYGTNNQLGNEYGHICGVNWGGGNSYLTDVFSQVDEIGVVRPYGNDRGRFVGARIEACRGECLEVISNSNIIQSIQLTSACRDSGANGLLSGHCDYLDDRGDNTFVGINGNNDGYFGADYSTGVYWPAGSSYWFATTGKIENVYGQFGIGNYFSTREGNNTLGGTPVTGTNPDIRDFNHIYWADTSPVMVTGVQNALIMQDIWISTNHADNGQIVPNTNVTLVSTLNGGSWQTCDGQNIHFSKSSIYHFLVEDVVATKLYVEQCDVADRNVGFFGYGTTALPPQATRATVDVAGDIISRPQSNIADPTILATGTGTGYTYCSAMLVRMGGGVLTTHNVCGNTPPSASTVTQFG